MAALLCVNAAADDDITKRVDAVFKDWVRTDAPGCALVYNSEYDITLNFTGNGFELRTGELQGLKFERNNLRK